MISKLINLYCIFEVSIFSDFMKKIQMVDLQGQYQQIKETVDTSIQSVLDTSTYINCPLVKDFQKDLDDY